MITNAQNYMIRFKHAFYNVDIDMHCKMSLTTCVDKNVIWLLKVGDESMKIRLGYVKPIFLVHLQKM